MATFLQNIAPGVGSLAEGYLKGEANTQEKYRQEELTRQKDALSTYMKLVESGHWEPVDPEKGASTPGVLSIGGVGWLQPTEVPAWEKAKYENEAAGRVQDRLKWEFEARKRAEEEGNLVAKRQHDRAIEQIQLEQARAVRDAAVAREKTAEEKKEKPEKIEFTDVTTGVTTPLTMEDYERIANEPVTKLAPPERALRSAIDKGTLVRGKFGTAAPKLPNELQIDRNSMDAQKRREQLMKDAAAPTVSDAGGVEIATQLNDLTLDTMTRYYTWRPNLIQKGGKLVPFELPIGRDKSGKPMQMTMGIVRQKAKEQGVNVEAVLTAIQQAMGRK